MPIPSNFQVILDTVQKCVHGRRALDITDALMEALPRPPGTCLCACNRMWIPLVEGKPVGEDGHGWDDCPAGRETK